MKITRTLVVGVAGLALALAIPGAASGADPTTMSTSGPAERTYHSPKPTTGITRIDIVSSGVAFGGQTFGTVGTYEKLRGKAYGELDPNDRRNAAITDLKLAPRNTNGKVEYSTDIYILKPTDLTKGNHKIFTEVNNRGNKLFGGLNGSPLVNDLNTAAHAGDAFLFNQGYTLVWSGWDPAALASNNGLTITVPIAKNRDGSSITGPSYEYISFDNATTTSATLSYPAASPDTSQATLTVKDHLTDQATVIPASGWAYTSPTTIGLLPVGTPFKQSSIYEFSYTAKDPTVNGIGFAATRDVLSFLRNDTIDAAGNKNPLAGDITGVYGYAVSQPARYLNDYLWLGFNEDTTGRKVFDGIENWIGGGTGVALNYRFGQSQRTERIRQNHLYPEAPFPFSYTTVTDRETGQRDGRNLSCTKTKTCPKIMSVNSSNEYWSKAASLLHTDLRGRDIAAPANVRYYLISSTEHASIAAAPNSTGVCAQPRNTIDPTTVERALFMSLVRWAENDVQPPATNVPTVAQGTLVQVQPTNDSPLGIGNVPATALGWPSIPGVTYTGNATIRNLLDFGPRFDKGIIENNPPKATGTTYPTYVPKVDADGNEIGGIRLPDVAAPAATYTGWGVRANQYGGPDGCEAFGQTIALPKTAADRASTGDPRQSLAERYGDHNGYVAAVRQAAEKLQGDGLLLPKDVDAYIAKAEASDVLK